MPPKAQVTHLTFLATTSKSIIFIPWIALISCILGLFLLSGLVWIAPLFFLMAYITLFLATAMVSKTWQDPLNPISLLVLIGFVRFSIPGFLSFRTEPDFLIFQIMGLEKTDWVYGHALALIGLLCVIIGWMLSVKYLRVILEYASTFLNTHWTGVTRDAAVLGMLVGFLALVFFVGGNTLISEAIVTGEFRGTEIQVGTGKFYYLSLLLIASSVVFASYLLNRKYAWWIALLPTFTSLASFWILGGRGTAFTPFAAGLLLLWYQSNKRQIQVRGILIFVTAFLPVFFYMGQLYRGRLGIEGVVQAFSIPNLLEYIKTAIWVDWGQLHSLAGATAAGPGMIGGRTFLILLWPLSDLLNLSGKSAGVFVTQTLVGISEWKWGFHASLIGDAYLNFGLIGVFTIIGIFGHALKILYSAMRNRLIDKAIYVIIIVYSTRIFFESIGKYTDALTVFIFTLVIIKAGNFFRPKSQNGFS